MGGGVNVGKRAGGYAYARVPISRVVTQLQALAEREYRGLVIWSPDDKFIGFMSTRSEGRPQIFVIPVDGGEARQVTTLKQGVGSGPSWSPPIQFTPVSRAAATASAARGPTTTCRLAASTRTT